MESALVVYHHTLGTVKNINSAFAPFHKGQPLIKDQMIPMKASYF